MKFRPVGTEIFPYGWADRQADMMKVTIVFRNIAKAPEMFSRKTIHVPSEIHKNIYIYIYSGGGIYSKFLKLEPGGI